ncbi:MAG: transglutaminase domain-containing protein [Candidatus Eisenbacteria bacterium]|nr:transglutaminase domain-containing protein [Candidatus Eisenbacteria bacterium]
MRAGSTSSSTPKSAPNRIASFVRAFVAGVSFFGTAFGVCPHASAGEAANASGNAFRSVVASAHPATLGSRVVASAHPATLGSRVAASAHPATLGSRVANSARPAGLRSRVDATLARHADGERISAWLACLPEDSLERDAAEWILAWLPLSDLAALDLPLLREHVEVAAESYRDAPWRDELPRDLWLHFVVPHRVSQEPAQAWRRAFREELLPRIQGYDTMEEAALAVNRWCREQATFKSTSGRDQGPLTTVARGIGRCEEEMILTISALRAAGIPARSCATPYWSFTDNNHAWVEAWADGRWWYLGGCEPDRCLNRAWFTGAASRTGFVRSVGYGEFDPSPEPLYRAEDGSTIINSTRVYTDPIRVTASLAGSWADSTDLEIHVNVLNFGSLRSVARVRSGDTIELGPGEYAFTAGDGETLLLQVAGGRSGDEVQVILDDSDRYDLTASPGFWLRYPESDARPVRDLDLVAETEQKRMERNIATRESDRSRLRTPTEAERVQLDGLPEGERKRLETVFEKPFPRISTLFALLGEYPEGDAHVALLDFLEMADDKDLLELDLTGIRSHIDHALEVRKRFALAMPDSIFSEGILACRIEREPGGPWRESLPLLPAEGDAWSALRSMLAAWVARTDTEDETFFGAPLDPSQTWKLGVGTERDVKVGFVGLLRRNGIPARYRHGTVEAWIDGWYGVDPVSGTVAGDDASAEGEGGSGYVEIAITRDGEPYGQAESYRDFNVSRPRDGWLESPWWDPVLGRQEWDSGTFILCSANRVPGGSIFGRLRSFEIRPGETTHVEIPIDIEAGWDPGDAFVSGVDPDQLRSALGEAGLPAVDDALTFVFEPGEPAVRMIEALGRVKDRLAASNVPVRCVLVVDGEVSHEPERTAASVPAELRDALREQGFAIAAHLSRATLVSLSPSSAVAPVVLLELEGDVHYLRAGFDTSVDGGLQLALDLAGQ